MFFIDACKSAVVVLIGSSLAACSPEGASNEGNEPVIRGLKTVIVKEQEETTLRRFPSVLQPAEITTLSFEAPGKLGPVTAFIGKTE